MPGPSIWCGSSPAVIRTWTPGLCSGGVQRRGGSPARQQMGNQTSPSLVRPLTGIARTLPAFGGPMHSIFYIIGVVVVALFLINVIL